MTPVEQITSLYIGYFGRAPDPEGLNYWVGRLADGFSLAEIAESFSVQSESQTKYPYLSNPNIASPDAFISQVYMNLFNRMPDAAGLAYWRAELQNGANVGDFILDVISGAQGVDKTIIDNKIEVGADFALEASNEPGFVYDTDAANAAVEVIEGVDATDASVAEGKAETDAFFDAGPAPTVSVLTTAIDAITGTAGADQINGVFDGAATSTFNTGDSINGGAGEDTLSLIITSGAQVTPASITNVETITVQDLAGGNINLNNATGVETISANGSDSVTRLFNLGNLVDLELNDVDGGGLEVDFDASVVVGAADAVSVALNSSAAYVELNGVETVNLTVSGQVANVDSDEPNVLELEGGATGINIAGAGDLVLNDVEFSVATVDGSAATGDLTLDLTDSASATTATGGAGDDRFVFSENDGDDSFGDTDVVNGGAGIDTLVIGAEDFSLAADAAQFLDLTSVERVEFLDDDAVTLNGSTFTNSGITNLLINTSDAGDTDVINNAGSARTYEFGTNNAGSAEFRMSGAATTLNLALLGSLGFDSVQDDGATAQVGDLLVEPSATAPAGSVSTINLVSTGDLDQIGNATADATVFDLLNEQDFNSVGVIDAVAGSTINVTGDANLIIDGLANRGTINASAATGNLAVEGSQFTAFSAAVPATDLNADGDTLDAGEAAVPATAFESGADTINLGSGDAVVTFSSALDSGVADTTSGGTTLLVDVITGFTAGADGDILDVTFNLGDADYTAVATADQDEINQLAGGTATLQNAASIAADSTVADEWTAFTFQGQTYAMYSADGDTDYEAGTDLLVQLTGVTVSALTDANFA